MNTAFQSAMHSLFSETKPFFEAGTMFNPDRVDAESSVSAFLLALGGDEPSRSFLDQAAESDATAAFFRESLGRVEEEIVVAAQTPEFARKLEDLAKNPTDQTCIWNVFFPEGSGLPETRIERVQALRKKRRVRIAEPNPNPLIDPGRELLFTSNVLLTIPSTETRLDELDYSAALKSHIRKAIDEEQVYWYDHPIQIGVPSEANEILYGLRGLDEAVEFERTRGNMGEGKITCVLSVSVTHKGLQGLAKDYIESEIRNAGGFRNIEVYVFTESDTQQLINEVLVPAGGDATGLEVFGVDGEYGRHYSFLKAISALWNATKDPNIKATFKIDLDQVFPQRELVEQSGASTFEHFKTPLWGARGTDSEGNPIELGMIAGALVNEKDIHKGLFTPDVLFPENPTAFEEHIFFSKMLMALSTEGELMTRYGKSGIDGTSECIQRIHVTGGTNGILVDSLKRHRPFTPSFIGRAEDQSYILSVLLDGHEKLAYVHEDGLIMRHDKEAFAGDAIKAASFGNMIGDYIRTLYFSEYARTLTDDDIETIKKEVAPFTGCFITPIPVTVVMMRFCMKAAEFYLAGNRARGTEFITASHPRLARAMTFVQEGLREQYLLERQGWNQFYDLIETVQENDVLHAKAIEIIESCRVQV